MSGITTHVLDTAAGRPAVDVPITLERRDPEGKWSRVASGRTGRDGRLQTLLTTAPGAGVYRLLFDTRTYFAATGSPIFYPDVVVTFATSAGEEHYHVPLLLSPYGYSTYRGS